MENEDENDDIHGNSKESKKKQHLYEIVDTIENEVIKYGISGQKITKKGTSPRATQQVNLWNLIEGFKRFVAFILKKNIENREKALAEEKNIVREFKEKHDGDLPDRQKRPNP